MSDLQCNHGLPYMHLPITPQNLNDKHNFLNLGNAEDATFWCCINFMFFLMARKSNMVSFSMTDFDPDKQLFRQDIVIFKVVLLVLV